MFDPWNLAMFCRHLSAAAATPVTNKGRLVQEPLQSCQHAWWRCYDHTWRNNLRGWKIPKRRMFDLKCGDRKPEYHWYLPRGSTFQGGNQHDMLKLLTMLFLHKTLALAGFRAICRSALKKHRNFRHCCLLEIPKRPCKLIKNPDKHCKRQSYYILLLLVSTCGVQDRKNNWEHQDKICMLFVMLLAAESQKSKRHAYPYFFWRLEPKWAGHCNLPRILMHVGHTVTKHTVVYSIWCNLLPICLPKHITICQFTICIFWYNLLTICLPTDRSCKSPSPSCMTCLQCPSQLGAFSCEVIDVCHQAFQLRHVLCHIQEQRLRETVVTLPSGTSCLQWSYSWLVDVNGFWTIVLYKHIVLYIYIYMYV